MSFNDVFQRGIDEVNKLANTDEALKDVLKQYDGRRVFLNVVGDATYVVTVSSEGVSLATSKSSNPEDMCLEIDKRTANELLDREVDPLKVISMVLFGKIKVRNIGPKEIDLVKRLIGASPK